MTGEVEHLVGEAPLVVVPGDQLHEVIVQGEISNPRPFSFKKSSFPYGGTYFFVIVVIPSMATFFILAL